MDDEDGKYILHTKTPRVKAKVIRKPGDNKEEIEKLVVVEKIDQVLTHFQNAPLSVTAFMRQLSDWWVAFKEHDAALNDDVY